MRTVCAWMLCAITAGAAAQQASVDVYLDVVRQGNLQCTISYKMARNHAQAAAIDVRPDLPLPPDSDYRGCIRSNNTALRAAYERAVVATKKQAAKAALKEHYIAAATMLEGIEPAANELAIDYQRRQTANEARVAEKWIRYGVER